MREGREGWRAEGTYCEAWEILGGETRILPTTLLGVTRKERAGQSHACRRTRGAKTGENRDEEQEAEEERRE